MGLPTSGRLVHKYSLATVARLVTQALPKSKTCMTFTGLTSYSGMYVK